MYNIIKRYVENENKNGLLLIDMPTGSGKTYSAVEFIYDSCMNTDNKDKKYIFVTTLKKNLPYEDLRKRFVETGNEKLFREKILMLDSNMDSVVEGWCQDVERAIPAEIKRCDEYKDFQKDLSFVKKQRETKSLMLREFLFSIETNLREKTEPRFRRLVSEYLGKNYRTVEQRIYAVKTDKNWQWLGKLYPAIFTKDRQVLLMSMDKFLGRNTTIVEPSYMFYNSNLIKNAVIFIDEFDATKDTILKKIIDNGLQDKVDYIELFKDIYAALHTDEFPTILTVPSKERLAGKYRTQTLESVVEGIKEKADHIYAAYSLQFKHRTLGDLSDTYQNYLFQDHQFHSILNANNSYITMQSDADQKINSIRFSQKKPERDKNNIQTMLGQLRGFITYFQGAVNILAVNYMQCKKERRKEGEDVFTMEASIRSVLSLFRLSNASIDYLTTQIMMASYKINGRIPSAEFDLSFYEKGFRYYAFENNTEHDMQSQIMMYSFQNTPEKTLLRYCEKAKVIGISATATVPSVIGNYDIDYLKDKMQKGFIETTPEEKWQLIDAFNESQKGYQNVNIHAELLGCKGSYSLQSWLSIFEDKEFAKMIYDKTQILYGEGEDKNDYCKKRYLRIGLAFKQFVIHEDIYSFLCVLNKHPRHKDRDLDKGVLLDIFSCIAKENHWNEYDDRKTLVFLDGSEYEDKKNDLIEKLAAGEKLFVISVYQTIGAGQNLQYPVPGSLIDSVVKINNKAVKNEKDFDAIYLDKPTNLIVPLSDNMEENEFVKYIFQMEFLQEMAEISSYDAMLNIKKAFRTFMMGHRNNDGFANIYRKKSVMLLSTRYIIQAIGRICRTNQKNKNIYIYADENIADSLDASVVEGRIFNPEFIALVDAVKKQGIKTPEIISLEDSASLRAVRVNKEIKNMLNNDWSEANIKKWKALRALVLTHPTISEEEAEKNFIIRNFYVQLPKPANSYFYYQQEDYNNVSISFNPDKDHVMKVSEEGTKLQHMLRIPGVRELFQRNGYATSFAINNYIMTPPLWNNIYKGALGEVVGKFLLEKNLKIVVREIEDPALFELFDYKVAESSVYIDFKNWHESVMEDKALVIRKIADKAKKCDCKCAVVANIYAEGNWSISDTEIDGIRIISLPCLVKSTDDKLCFDKKAWDILREVCC